MWSVEQIKSRITHALPGARLEIIPNDSPSGQFSLLVDNVQMRKDYVEPDDYEYEPTPHDEILERLKQHHAQEVKL